MATFDDLSIHKASPNYTLSATDGTVTSSDSNAFTVQPGAAYKLSFVQQPSNAVAGQSISPDIRVRVLDMYDNIRNDGTSIQLSLQDNPGNSTLGGTLTQTATISLDVTLDKVGTGYTLRATDLNEVVPFVISDPFNITPGPAYSAAWTTSPSNAGAGDTLTGVVTFYDIGGNVAVVPPNTIAPQVNITGPEPTSDSFTFEGSGPIDISGLGLYITTPGTSYTLSASFNRSSDNSTVTATSNSFDIGPGAAAKLEFDQQPTNTTAGSPIADFSVKVEDQFGNLLTTDSSTTVDLGLTTPLVSLNGSSSVTDFNGVATFHGLSIDKAGSYTGLAQITGKPTSRTVSNSFNINAGPAAKLDFSQTLLNTAHDTAFSPDISVLVEDVKGNPIPNDSGRSINLGFRTNPGNVGTLSGTLTQTDSGGLADFPGISIDAPSDGYSLVALSNGLLPGFSNTFSITGGAATQLVLSTQPSNTAPNAAMLPAVVVTAFDAQGHIATYSQQVTLSISHDPGAGGTLSGATATAVGGVATFSNVSIDKNGTGYTLIATDGTLSSLVSNPFNIVGGVNHLVFRLTPDNTPANHSITSVQVAAVDAQGNTVTTYNKPITVSIGTNAGPGGVGTLAGTTQVTAVNGLASFNNVSIDLAGAGYTLLANDGTLGSPPSDPFNITASKLVFTTQPVTTAAGQTMADVVVTAEDDSGNVDTTYNQPVTVSIGTNPNHGTLGGTTQATAINGVATFNTLNVKMIGVGYTLRATSGTLTSNDSDAFNITVGAATHLVVTRPPDGALAGSPLGQGQGVEVTAEDDFGNTDLTYSKSVMVSPGDPPSTTSVVAIDGVATFYNLILYDAGRYQVIATDGTLTSDPSSYFDIDPLPVSFVAFSGEPHGTVAGSVIPGSDGGNITVTAYDKYSNPTDDMSTMSIASGPTSSFDGSSTTTATTLIRDAAVFDNLKIDVAGTYMLRATVGAASYNSTPFEVTAGPAYQLKFGQQPSNTAVTQTIAPPVTVLVEDMYGNLVTTDSSNISLAIGTNGGPGGNLTGTTMRPAIGGIATFDDLKIDKLGTGYTLTASGSVTGSTSNTFDITSPAPTLSINDVSHNEGNAGATTYTFTVSLSAPANAGGVTFDIATADGTATTANNDYTATTLTAQTILAGSLTHTFDVTVKGDTAVEPDETFFVNVSNVTGATVSDGQGQGTIVNDDAAPLPNLTINDVSHNEGNAGATTFTFTVSLSAPANAGGVTFDIATADGTATTANNDYTATTLTAQTILAGSLTHTFDVTVKGDTAVESDETFFVNVTNVTGATVIDGQGQGTIVNDDVVLPTLSINDVSHNEGNAGATTFTFTVSLSAPANAGGVTFDIATADGTATTANNDYTATTLTAQTILAGSLTHTFDVTVKGDTAVEPDETFFVNVTNVTGATVIDGQGQGTIVNDDVVPPNLSINDVSHNEGNAGATTYTFTVSLSAPANAGGVTFDIATADGTATTANNDYTAKSLTGQTIAVGSSTHTFDVTVNGDTAVEANETFVVKVSNVTGATVTDGQGQGTIVNDDVTPTITLAPASLPGGKVGVQYNQTLKGSGGTAPYTFTLNGPLPNGITFTPSTGVLSGTPTAGGSFNFTVTATDSSPTPGPFTSPAKALSIVIAPPTISLSPAKLNTMKVGVAFSQSVVAAGGLAPYTYTLTGTLLTGLNFNTSSGLISGTPTAIGAFTFSISAKDSSTGTGPYSSPTQDYGAKIDPPTMLLNPGTSLPNGKVGAVYAAIPFIASGGTAPYSYTESGALPAGLTFAGGTISGTPTAAGTFSFAVTASDSSTGSGAPGSTAKVYKLIVAP